MNRRGFFGTCAAVAAAANALPDLANLGDRVPARQMKRVI